MIRADSAPSWPNQLPLLHRSSDSRNRHVDVVILAGSVGVDAPWTRGVPRPLLPLPGSSLIESLVDRFHGAFGGVAAICANGLTDLIAQRFASRETDRNDRPAWFNEDGVPRGTAGCLKTCQSRLNGDAIFVAGGAVWLDDDLNWMLEQHEAAGNALTVYCSRRSLASVDGEQKLLTPVGVYCCDPSVLAFIPDDGYFDLKEQLVPALQKEGLRVGAAVLPGRTCEVSDWPTYMQVMCSAWPHAVLQTAGYHQHAPGIWCGHDVHFGAEARVVGPALLGHGCRIEDGATVIGPVVLNDHCRVGSGSWVIRVVASQGTEFSPDTSIADRLVPTNDHLADVARGNATAMSGLDTGRAFPSIGRSAAGTQFGAVLGRLLLPGVLLAALFVWAFWHVFTEIWYVWQTNPDYSIGQLVPLAALYMMWTQRDRLSNMRLSPSWAGLVVFALGVGAHLFGSYFLYGSLERFGMVICANGLVMSLFGWHGYKRVWYPMLFLFLMLPLPGRVQDGIMLPLQGIGAGISATVLEMVGVPVERYGHVLEVAGRKTAVAEACNGLRMALAFVTVIGVVAYLVRRPLWQRIVVLASSIPIALACNVVRIVAMAYLHSVGQDWLLEGPLHDGAGMLMMPMALSIVMLELWVLSNLVVPAGLTAPKESVERMPAVSGR